MPDLGLFVPCAECDRPALCATLKPHTQACYAPVNVRAVKSPPRVVFRFGGFPVYVDAAMPEHTEQHFHDLMKALIYG